MCKDKGIRTRKVHDSYVSNEIEVMHNKKFRRLKKKKKNRDFPGDPVVKGMQGRQV